MLKDEREQLRNSLLNLLSQRTEADAEKRAIIEKQIEININGKNQAGAWFDEVVAFDKNEISLETATDNLLEFAEEFRNKR